MKSKKWLLLPALFIVTSCGHDLDMAGMFTTYESVNSRFNQSMAWNALHPPKEIVVNTDNYLIFCMGDNHTGGTTNLDKFLSIAKDSSSSAVVMAGDLTTGKEEDYLLFNQHLPPQDSLTTFLIAGNHDLYFDGWRHFNRLFGSSTYFFIVRTPAASDLFICLDTGSATLGEQQLNWLKDLLKTVRGNYRRCIIFSHTDLFFSGHESSTNFLVEEQFVILETLAAYRVDMFIAGHDHNRYEYTLGITNFVVMDALKDGLDNAGYLTLAVKNGRLEYHFYEI